MVVTNKIENQEQLNNKKRKKAMLWSLLWANVSMMVVVGATVLFLYYDYKQKMKYATSFTFDINPWLLIIAYVIGMLILWGIIYKYETKEIVTVDDKNQNHNIYY